MDHARAGLKEDSKLIPVQPTNINLIVVTIVGLAGPFDKGNCQQLYPKVIENNEAESLLLLSFSVVIF